MSESENQKMIDNFESHYNYDSTYMRELLESSPEGFTKFANFLPLASHNEKLSVEDYWVAKLAATQIEDCGDCLQLGVRMALESGLDRNLIKAIIHADNSLPNNLQDVLDYAKRVAAHEQINTDLMQRIESRYDKAALLEFGLAIAAAKVFPTIKRAAGYTKSCSLIEIQL